MNPVVGCHGMQAGRPLGESRKQQRCPSDSSGFLSFWDHLSSFLHLRPGPSWCSPGDPLSWTWAWPSGTGQSAKKQTHLLSHSFPSFPSFPQQSYSLQVAEPWGTTKRRAYNLTRDVTTAGQKPGVETSKCTLVRLLNLHEMIQDHMKVVIRMCTINPKTTTKITIWRLRANKPLEKKNEIINSNKFTKDLQMAREHMKRRSPSLVFREMRSKPQWDKNFTPTRMVVGKEAIGNPHWRECEELKTLTLH